MANGDDSEMRAGDNANGSQLRVGRLAMSFSASDRAPAAEPVAVPIANPRLNLNPDGTPRPVLLWSVPSITSSAREAGDPFVYPSVAADPATCAADAGSGRAFGGGSGCTLVTDDDDLLGRLAPDGTAALVRDPFWNAGREPECYKSLVAPGFAGACGRKLASSDLPPLCPDE